MKIKTKRFIAGFLSCAMLVSSVPMSSISEIKLPAIGSIKLPELNWFKSDDVYAAESYTYDIYTYTVYNGNATITDCSESATGNIEIPEELDGYQVTNIGYSAFENCVRVTSVSIPESVETIESYAFSGCTSLSTVTLGGVKKIGCKVFDGCLKLTNLKIPNTLTSAEYTTYWDSNDNYIYGGPFAGSGVQTIEFEEGIENIPDYICSGASALKNVTIPEKEDTSNGYSIGNYAFNKTSISKITLPNSLTAINYQAFNGCSLLTSVTVPGNVKTIGDNAFSDCIRLTNVSLSESVSTIGNYAFSGCTSLSTATLGGVEEIGYKVFDGCSKLTSLKIPNTLASAKYTTYWDSNNNYIYGGPFAGSGVQTVEFEEGIENIPAYICSGASVLKNVTLPEKEDNIYGYYIGDYAFYNTSIAKITLPDSLTLIGSHSFSKCVLLTSITIPNNVKTIRDYAFDGCANLKNASLSESVITIGNCAFSGCTSLSKATLGGVQKIGYKVFDGCAKLTGLKIPNTLTSAEYTTYWDSNNNYIYGGPFAGSGVQTVEFEEGIENIPAYICSGASVLVSVSIPDKKDTIEGYAIGAYAFYGCSFLSDINISNSITKIGRYAFANCKNIGTIRLPSSITSLDNTVFENSIVDNVQISKEDSSVAIVLIDNEIQYTADVTGIKDSVDKYLNRSKSKYYSTTSSVSAAGFISLVLDYSFKDTFKSLASDMSVKIKLPSAVTVTNDSVKIDGEAVDYTDEDGYLIIPVEKTSGSIRFSVEPNESTYLISYAQMECRINGSYKTETIGIVNMATKLLTINVPNETSNNVIQVKGLTAAKEEVSVYLDEKLVGTCTASAVGSYSSKVTLDDVSDGKVYKIEAKVTNSDGSVMSVLDYVTYNSESIELTAFDMYFRNNKYDLIKLNGTRPVISWAGGNTYTFNISFNYNDKLDVVRVVSTKGSEVRYINAVYDAKKNYYVATGFYDYVPGTISVEYKLKSDISYLEDTAVSVEDTYTLGSNINGYLTKLEFDDEDGSELYYYKEYERKADFKLTDNYHLHSENGENYYMSKADTWFYRDGGIFLGKECYTQNADGTYDAYRYGIGMFSDKKTSSSVESRNAVTTYSSRAANSNRYTVSGKAQNTQKTVETALEDLDSTIRDIIEASSDDIEIITPKDLCDKSKAIVNILNTKTYSDNTLYNSLNETIKSIQNSGNLSNDDQLKLEVAKTYLEAYNMTKNSSITMNNINDYIDNSITLSNDSSFLLPSFVSKKMQKSVDSMKSITDKESQKYLAEVMKILTEKDWWFGQSLLEKQANQAKDFKKSNVNLNPNNIIDPSGYVYEAVESNKLSGVEATIYYKETEDSEAVVWDAEEYDQMNPLLTDESGHYAWDVPEGLWQIEFKKNGYETAYSEWLPVPPEQLEVNIGMISTDSPKIELINAYDDELEVIFNQYVDISTVNSKNVKFTVDGKEITGKFTSINKEVSASNSKVELAKIFKFVPDSMVGGTVKCTASNITNYAGNKIEAGFTSTVEVAKKITEVKVDDSVTIQYGESGTVEIKATPAEAAAGKKVLLYPEYLFFISIPKSVIFDETGIAVIPIESLLPGETIVKYEIEGSTLAGTINVISSIGDPEEDIPEEMYRLGDVNGDGEITLKDIVAIARYIAGGWNVEINEDIADVNGDGEVTLKDIVMIARYITGGWGIEL